MILEHYGTCSAITALDQVAPGDAGNPGRCIERLIRHLHAQLVFSIRADLTQRGHAVPGEVTTIAELIAGRDWLFADEAYHTDVSHLSATVRYSILVADPATLGLAVDLTEYGRRLSPRLQYEGRPPFDRTFDDHRIFLRALLGQDVDAAISHFRTKVDAVVEDDLESSMPAQVLVNLLVRMGKLDEAIDLAASRLAHLPEQALTCPGLAQLCQQRGRMVRLAEVARQQGDMVHFLAARLNATMLRESLATSLERKRRALNDILSIDFRLRFRLVSQVPANSDWESVALIFTHFESICSAPWCACSMWTIDL